MGLYLKNVFITGSRMESKIGFYWSYCEIIQNLHSFFVTLLFRYLSISIFSLDTILSEINGLITF